MTAETPGQAERAERAEPHYRIHPLAAWTAQRRLLGDAPQDLLRDEDAVAVVRLPDGWPVVIQGPPALVWKDLAEAAGTGRSARELAAPWTERGGDQDAVVQSLGALLEGWEGQGLVALCDAGD